LRPYFLWQHWRISAQNIKIYLKNLQKYLKIKLLPHYKTYIVLLFVALVELPRKRFNRLYKITATLQAAHPPATAVVIGMGVSISNEIFILVAVGLWS
jgi:hypothetical protein